MIALHERLVAETQAILEERSGGIRVVLIENVNPFNTVIEWVAMYDDGLFKKFTANVWELSQLKYADMINALSRPLPTPVFDEDAERYALTR